MKNFRNRLAGNKQIVFDIVERICSQTFASRTAWENYQKSGDNCYLEEKKEIDDDVDRLKRLVITYVKN